MCSRVAFYGDCISKQRGVDAKDQNAASLSVCTPSTSDCCLILLFADPVRLHSEMSEAHQMGVPAALRSVVHALDGLAGHRGDDTGAEAHPPSLPQVRTQLVAVMQAVCQ